MSRLFIGPPPGHGPGPRTATGLRRDFCVCLCVVARRDLTVSLRAQLRDQVERPIGHRVVATVLEGALKVAGDLDADLLPDLRRYTRTLSGSQATSDRHAGAILKALLLDRSVFESGLRHEVALHKAIYAIWMSSGMPTGGRDGGIARRAEAHLAKLAPNTRKILL